MKKANKTIVTTAAISLLSACLLGCGADSSAGSNGDPAGSAGKQVTLRFSWWGGDARHKATLDAINLYKQSHPNVTIEAEYGGFDGYEQKIKTQLAGGTAPDLMQLDQPWLAELSSGDLLLDLGGQKTLDASKFDAGYLKSYMTYNSKLVGLPMGSNGRAMIFNKTLADKLGINVNQAWTWDALLSEAKKLHDKDAKMYLLNSDLGLVQVMFTNYVRQQTGSPLVKDDYSLGFTKEQAAAGFGWLQQAFKNGVFQPVGESQLFTGKTDQNPKWINQELVGYDGWSSEIGKYKDALPKGTVVETVLPALAPGAKSGAAQMRPSMVLSINKKSEQAEEALKFADWLLSDPEAAKVLGDVRAVPALEAAKKTVVDAGKLDKDVAKAVELAGTSPAVADNAISQNSQLGDITKDIVQKIAFDKTTPEQAADELTRRLTEKLKELKK